MKCYVHFPNPARWYRADGAAGTREKKKRGYAQMSKAEKPPKTSASVGHRIGVVIATVLCVLLVPILIINITLIVRSFTKPDKVPSIGWYFPLIVLTDSMFPEIESGDLIICRRSEPEDIRVGDVIAFFDPAGNGTSIVTHSVAQITQVNGQTAWITRGIANNADDALPVTADKLAGVYTRRIPGLGNVVMFVQSTAGLIVCVICPILLLVIWDLLRRRTYEKRKQADTDALLRELEALRAQKAQQTEDDRPPTP